MHPLTEDEIDWIDAHFGDDIDRLRLRHHGDTHLEWLIMQLYCRRKAATKLSSTLREKRFIFPTELSAEQCTSDAVARLHLPLLRQGGTLLDMTCGLGIDVFAAAGVCSHVTAIDIDPDVAEAAAVNAAALGLGNITVVNADSVEWLRNSDSHFDTIFIDPARRGDKGRRLFALADCKPDISTNLDMVMVHCDRLVIKASPMLDISAVMDELNMGCDIHIIGTKDECKEFVITLPGNGLITAQTVGHANDLAFSRADEERAEAKTGIPRQGDWLYEPYPAVVKSGAYKTVAERYGITKIDTNVHLYHSANCVTTFPGTMMRVIDVIPFSKKGIKEVATHYPEISVTTKNFKMTSAQLSARLKNRESGSRRLFAVTAAGQALLIVAERVVNGVQTCGPSTACPHVP